MNPKTAVIMNLTGDNADGIMRIIGERKTGVFLLLQKRTRCVKYLPSTNAAMVIQ